jgi:hypothetical protein
MADALDLGSAPKPSPSDSNVTIVSISRSFRVSAVRIEQLRPDDHDRTAKVARKSARSSGPWSLHSTPVQVAVAQKICFESGAFFRRDPRKRAPAKLKVWQQGAKALLLDGHNRYQICRQHKIPFKIQKLQFDDRLAAKSWIVRNQLSRRNLAPYQRGELALELEAVLRQKAKANQRAAGGDRTSAAARAAALHQNSEKPLAPVDTNHALAQVAGLSHDTIAKIRVLKAKAPQAVKDNLRAARPRSTKSTSGSSRRSAAASAVKKPAQPPPRCRTLPTAIESNAATSAP